MHAVDILPVLFVVGVFVLVSGRLLTRYIRVRYLESWHLRYTGHIQQEPEKGLDAFVGHQ